METKQVKICQNPDCKFIQENAGKEPCSRCGGTEFKIEEREEEEKQETQEVLEEMTKDKEMIHYKIEFDTDARNKNFSSTISKILIKLLKTLDNLKVGYVNKEDHEKEQKQSKSETDLGLDEEEIKGWK